MNRFYVEPVGQRSMMNRLLNPPTNYTNQWRYHPECEDEFELLRNKKFDSEMSGVEQIDALASLEMLIDYGCEANLRFPGPYVKNAEVEAKEIEKNGRQYLIELRHVPENDRQIFGRARRVLRLYYYEPIEHDRLLAALVLDSKPGDRADLNNEQNAAIETAHSRATQWRETNFAI